MEILKEPENNLVRQYELIATEGVKLKFTEGAISEIARIASQVNDDVENIGARRLHTILEKVLDDISFSASDKKVATVNVDDKYVQKQMSEIYKDNDLSKIYTLAFLDKSLMLLPLHFVGWQYHTINIF